MKIAQIAPLIERVPPKRYGGTERVIYTLTEELIKRGHDVTLFASGDSITSAKLISVYPQNLREANLKNIYGVNIWTLLNIGLAYSQNATFDIIHDHTGYLSLPTANIVKTPTVMTMHGAFGIEDVELLKQLQRPYIVTISKSQGNFLKDFNHLGTVYNGLFMENYPFSEEHENYLLFVGRICYEKGVHFAIKAAMFLNLPLIIAAKLEKHNPRDIIYFKKEVKPWLNGKIRWIGEVTEEERNKLFSKAMVFLHPITWEEPFGLTLIEAMACGCPVIAFNKGSIPEIIKEGKTGFVVSTFQEMCKAIINISSIQRKTCRQYSLANFNAQRMTSAYEKLYKKCIENQNSKTF